VFDKYAKQYQDKYMSFAPYTETYGTLATMVPEGSSILDVACGPGNISHYLNDRIANLKLTGCDLSPEMIQLARKNLPNGHFELRDSRDINGFQQMFDVVVCGFCCPYLTMKEVGDLIASSRQILNNDGLLYLSTMEGDYQDSGYPENATDDRIFTYYHSAEFLKEQLTSNGFEVFKIEKKPFIENGTTTAIDLFMYARAI